MTFRATFTNKEGLRLTLRFRNSNWNGIVEAAQAKYTTVHAEHDRYGPWTLGNIDVAA